MRARAILWAALVAGCVAKPAPRPAPKFDDLEACLAVLEEVAARRIQERATADLTACGGGRIDSDDQALKRAAEWVARRRSDAKAAEQKELVAAVDQVASAVLPVRLAGTGEAYELPVSQARGNPVPPLCRYTAVKAEEARRESCGMAQLQPHRTPPLARLEGARTDVIEFPILIVADAGLPAVRVLAVAFDYDEGGARLAVRRTDGQVFEHPVQLRGRAEGGIAGRLTLSARDDAGSIALAVDAIRQRDPAVGLAIAVEPDVTAQTLVQALDEAARAGFSVAIGAPR